MLSVTCSVNKMNNCSSTSSVKSKTKSILLSINLNVNLGGGYSMVNPLLLIRNSITCFTRGGKNALLVE